MRGILVRKFKTSLERILGWACHSNSFIYLQFSPRRFLAFVFMAGVPSNFAVVAVYKLNQELKSICIENKNGMGSPMSYILAKTILVTPILFVFAFAALGVPAYIIQDYPIASFGRMVLLWTVQIAGWEASAEAFAAFFDHVVLGMMVHTGWWFLALLFSGYLVPLSDVSLGCILGSTAELFWALFLIRFLTTVLSISDVLASQDLLLHSAVQLLCSKCRLPHFHWKNLGSMHRSNNERCLCG